LPASNDVAEARIDEMRRLLPDGEEPAQWRQAAIQSGAREQQQAVNRQNTRLNRARLWRLKLEGYTFDSERRLVAPPKPIVSQSCAETRSARPRERRARRSSTSARGDPDPEPELASGNAAGRPSPRPCKVCGKPFTPLRRSKGSTLCGPACKQKAWRQRKGTSGLSVTHEPLSGQGFTFTPESREALRNAIDRARRRRITADDAAAMGAERLLWAAVENARETA
jgi:hypothetical protein